MRIIMPGELKHMSMVVCICSNNFCTFVADGRLVTHGENGGLQIISDKVQKIHKINNHVLFGYTGWFDSREEITAPLDVFLDKSAITLRLAHKAILDYVARNKNMIAAGCNYLLGGKDNKGRFCIYEMHVNSRSKDVETTIRMPQPPETMFAYTCALPPALYCRLDEIINQVNQSITGSTHHDEMILKVEDIIRELSATDETIGPETMSLSIF